jgi:hypothetical protein
VYGDIYEVMDYETTTDDEVVDRWPWVENAEDDLSGEASMVANPGGTFMYAVWNQWREEFFDDGTELIYDSDMWFRRFLYLPDEEEVPTTEASAVNSAIEVDEALQLVGEASSPLGIEEVLWEHTFDGVTTVVGNQMELNIPGNTLQPGWSQFTFKAKDKDGKWSPGVDVMVLVADTLYKTYLPAISNPTTPAVNITFISSQSITVEDQLVMIAEAFAPEGSEIVEVVWTLTYQGVTTVVGSDYTLNVQPGNLHPGWQQFVFKAKDKGGRWSPGVSVMVWVD